MRSFSHSALTLIELLIALTLSLLLLFAVTELFSRIGRTMNDTRTAMTVSSNLNEVAIQLRRDLARIHPSLPVKPERIVDPDVDEVDDRYGYLEIIEGPDSIGTHPYVNEKGEFDSTVGDVDDIIAFTVIAQPGVPLFRGLIDGQIAEREAAEIIWFVRGNTLYRRMRLLDMYSTDDDDTAVLGKVARRENRYMHRVFDPDPSPISGSVNSFPYPLYSSAQPGWRYLRVPTLEETTSAEWTGTPSVSQWKTEPVLQNPREQNPDLWNQPLFFPPNGQDKEGQDRKSGSLEKFVETPRNHRAGEDVVLTNVLSFDIKVWDSITKEFVDLGTLDTNWDDKYNNQLPHLPRTWDSWTREYVDEQGANGQPPYTQPLEAIQITIRCFDPSSRAIKQVTVVHRFAER
jgi:type II secretory pathway pseudopilin PulG